MNRLKAIVIIKIDLKGTANPVVQYKGPQDPCRETNTATVNTVSENGFNATLIQTLKLFRGNRQIHDDTFQKINLLLKKR
jgi:hypothetical protein